MTPIRYLCIFDTDKTLVDFTEVHNACYRRAIKRYFEEERDMRDLAPEQTQGQPQSDIIRLLAQAIMHEQGLSLSGEQIIYDLPGANNLYSQTFAAILNEHSKNNTLEQFMIPGVRDFLTLLKEAGDVGLGVYTGGQGFTLNFILYTTELACFFQMGGEFMTAYHDLTNPMTRIEMIRDLVSRLMILGHCCDLPPASVFVFGDSVYDIAAANEVGASPIAVTGKSSFSAEQIAEYSPFLTISTFNDPYSPRDLVERLLK